MRGKKVFQTSFLISVLSLVLAFCDRKPKITDEEPPKHEVVENQVKITGIISAGQDFAEETMTTGQMVTGRIVTGRVVTARTPRLLEEKRVRVSGARVTVEELGISAESDSNGRFFLPVRVTDCPCAFTISVRAVRKDGRSYRIRQRVEIGKQDVKAGEKDLGDILIHASGGVVGNVRLKDARSSVGIYVYVPGTPIVGMTDENGNFIIGDVPPGKYKFVMEKVGYESRATDDVHVKAGEITYIGDFELGAQVGPGYISGRVVDTDGKPLAGVFVVSDTGRTAVSDKYGNFQIPSDARRLTVGKEGYEFVTVVVESRELEVELKRTAGLRDGSVKGKIYNWVTTKPVGGVTVLLLPMGIATTTDRDGGFAIPDVPPGSYILMFIRSDYEIGIEPVSIASGQVVDLGILGLLPECILVKFYRDSDGDGFGDADIYTEDCYAPFGYVGNSNDCDDSRTSVHPGAAELCNGLDDNCDGEVDENVALVFYRDSDGDGFGDPNSISRACARPSGYVSNSYDCEDQDASIKPTATEICDEKDQDCDGFANNGIVGYYFMDSDGDGQGWGGSATLACLSASGLKDIYGNAVVGYVSNSLDCDDSNPDVRFGTNETRCDGRDENCNGIVDDGVLITFYRDSDGDGYGDRNMTVQACARPTGYVENLLDCDDRNSGFNPSVTEIVDGMDENCNGQVDDLNFDIAVISSLSPVHYLDLDSDASGNLHVVFNYTAYGGSKWLAYGRTEQKVWQIHTRYLGSGDIFSCSVDVSPDGSTAYFSFSTTTGGACADSGVCMAYRSADGWSSALNINPTGTYSSIAFVEDLFGQKITHVVYSTASSIVHTYATSPEHLTSSVIASSVSVTDIDMVVSADGATVHVVFAQLDGGAYYPYYTRNVSPNDFRDWLTPIRISSYNYDVRSVSIALYSDGTTHVCFTGRNTPKLYHTRAKRGEGFDAPREVDGSGPMSSCSIAVDRDGNPHMAYYSKGFGELRYAVLYSGMWKVYRVFSLNFVPEGRAIALVIDGRRVPRMMFVMNGFPAHATLKPEFR